MLAQQGHQVQGLTSRDLDLNFPDRVFDFDFKEFDLLLNSSGHSQGTYRGFLQNSWHNQISQIMVNYAGNLALLKHFANSRKDGKFVWISTSLMHEHARPFHSVYISSKQASKTAIDLISKEANHIQILEVNVGLTKTGFRHRNFEGTKSHQEVNIMYDQEHSLTAEYVAGKIVDAINKDIKEIHIQ
jgi:short-subunit dehydrogenase